MKTKAEQSARGHLLQYKRAEKNENKEVMAEQRERIRALGFDIKDGDLVKKAAAKKPATKKEAPAKKAAAKKPAAKKAAAKTEAEKPAEPAKAPQETKTKPAESGKSKGTTKMTKKERSARGHLLQYRKAEKAGDKQAMADQRDKIHAMGFNITKDGLVKRDAAKKPAAKKAAPKKAAAKKAAPKKAAAKKAAPKKAAAKKAAPKKAAAKGGRKTSKKGPAFPAAGKGGKVQAKTAQTTYRKGGRTYTKTVTRTFRENPMGEVGTMLTLLLFGTVGAIGSDMLDRWIAIMPERKEGDTSEYKLLSGSAAAVAISRRPDGKRIAAQGALLLLFGALAWYFNKKGKKTASIVTGAIALGVGIRSLLQVINGYAMPAVLESSKDASKPSFGDYMYPAEQAAAQADLDNALKGYLNGELAAPAAAPGKGATLAGIGERLGAATPTVQTLDRRPANAVVPSNQVARELTRPVAPAARVGAPQNTPALTQGASSSLAREHGKLGCGGPSCGPSCGCDTCKRDFGNNPLAALLNPRPPVARPALPPAQGATTVPTPASQVSGLNSVLPFAPKRPVAVRGAVPHMRSA